MALLLAGAVWMRWPHGARDETEPLRQLPGGEGGDQEVGAEGQAEDAEEGEAVAAVAAVPAGLAEDEQAAPHGDEHDAGLHPGEDALVGVRRFRRSGAEDLAAGGAADVGEQLLAGAEAVDEVAVDAGTGLEHLAPRVVVREGAQDPEQD